MSSQLLHEILRWRDRSKVGTPHSGALLQMNSPREALSSIRCGEPYVYRNPEFSEEVDIEDKWRGVISFVYSFVLIFLR